MKRLLIGFYIIFMGLAASGQNYVFNFPVDSTADGSEFIPFQTKVGSNYLNWQMPFPYAKRYFTPDIASPIAYVPTLTGNTANKMRFVRHSDGRVWFIDWQGASVLVNDPNVSGVTNLSIANRTSTGLDIASNTGADASVPLATTSLAGLMSAADKVKVDAALTVELDGSPTNELQVLSIAGSNLTLSNGGGTVAIPGGGPTINTTDNTLPKRQNSGAFTNSLITDDGTTVQVVGTGKVLAADGGAALKGENLFLERVNNSTGAAIINMTINPVTLTLPAGVNDQVKLIFNSCGSSFVVDPNGSETIDGKTTITMQNGDRLILLFNGATSDWMVSGERDSEIDTLGSYNNLRAYTGSAKAIFLNNFTKVSAYTGLTYTTVGGLFVRSASGSENGGTVIVATNGVKWARVINNKTYSHEWWEIGGRDEVGAVTGNFLTSTAGIHSDADRLDAVGIIAPAGSTIIFGLVQQTIILDHEVEKLPNNSTYDFNHVLIIRTGSPVTTTTSNTATATITVASAAGFRAGQYLNIIDESLPFGGNGGNESLYVRIASISGNTINLTATPSANWTSGKIVMLEVGMFSDYVKNLTWRNANIDGNKLNIGGGGRRYIQDFRYNHTFYSKNEPNTTFENCYVRFTPGENFILASGKIMDCRGDSLDGSYGHLSSSGLGPRKNGLFVDNLRINGVCLATDQVSEHCESFITYSVRPGEVILQNCIIKNCPSAALPGLDIVQDDTMLTKVINCHFENFRSILDASYQGFFNQNIQKYFLEVTGSNFIKCGSFYFLGDSLEVGDGVLYVTFDNCNFVDPTFIFDDIAFLRFTNNTIRFDATMHKSFAESARTYYLNLLVQFRRTVFDIRTVKNAKFLNNTIENFKTLNDSLVTCFHFPLEIALRQKNSGGTNLDFYYSQDVEVRGNKILGFVEGIKVQRSLPWQTIQSGSALYQTVGWQFNDNLVLLSKDTISTAKYSGRTYGIECPPGAICNNNTILQQTPDASQVGMVLYGAGTSDVATRMGATAKLNYIYSLAASGNDIEIGDPVNAFWDRNCIVTDNLTRRPIGFNTFPANKSYLARNELLGTIFPNMTTPNSILYQFTNMNANQY